jgi:hypothetical protein
MNTWYIYIIHSNFLNHLSIHQRLRVDIVQVHELRSNALKNCLISSSEQTELSEQFGTNELYKGTHRSSRLVRRNIVIVGPIWHAPNSNIRVRRVRLGFEFEFDHF